MAKPLYKFAPDLRRISTTGINNGKYHIKLWVTFMVQDGVKKRWVTAPYKTGLFATPEEFKLILDRNKTRIPVLLSDVRSKLNDIDNKAKYIIDTLSVNDQAKFDSYFLSEYKADSLRIHFDTKINELEAAKKFSSKEKYVTAIYSIAEFFGYPPTFTDCTPVKLQAYEDWYTSQDKIKDDPTAGKKSLTSVGINMRCLRHIFKRAIDAGVVPVTIFPFGVGKYVIPEGGSDGKKFLGNSQKDQFITWTHADDRKNELHDYCKFSYYANGINMSDIARLRKPSVFPEYISITRQKTKGKKKKSKKLIIPMHPVMLDIIRRRGKKSLDPSDYIFPILDNSMDEETIFYKIRDLVDDVNDMLAIMGKELNFDIKPTSYTLRHTFSFQFMQLGGTTDELQDALAHGNSKTTENYKHGFLLERKKKFSDGL